MRSTKKKTDQLIEKAFKDKTYDTVKSGFKLHDLVQFAKVLENYQIIVYDDRYLHQRPLYRSKKKSVKKINLFYITRLDHIIAIGM